MVKVRLGLLICLLVAACVAAVGEGKKKPEATGAAEYAVVGGTVFRDNGFALPEADVTLELVQDPAATAKSKVKKWKAVTSPRGEFTFRVPPAAANYRVAVAARGFQAAEKVVHIEGGTERADATFTLSPESKH